MEVISGYVRHGHFLSLVTGNNAGYHHGQRTRYVQVRRKQITAHHHCQCNEHFYLVMVNGTQQVKTYITQNGSLQNSASGFLDEQPGRLTKR